MWVRCSPPSGPRMWLRNVSGGASVFCNMEQVTDRVMEEIELLSELSLTEEERTFAKADMEEMLRFFQTMNEAELMETETGSPDLSDFAELRKDEITGTDGRAATLSNAPLRSEDFFVVPRTIGEAK